MALSSFVRSRRAWNGALSAFTNVKNQSRCYGSGSGSDSEIPKFTKVDLPGCSDAPDSNISFVRKHGDETIRLVAEEYFGSLENSCIPMNIHVSYGSEHDKPEIVFKTEIFPDQIKLLAISLKNMKGRSAARYLKLLGSMAKNKGINMNLHTILKDHINEREAETERRKQNSRQIIKNV